MPSEDVYVVQARDGVKIRWKSRPQSKPTDLLFDMFEWAIPGGIFHSMNFEELRTLADGEYTLGDDGRLRPKAIA